MDGRRLFGRLLWIYTAASLFASFSISALLAFGLDATERQARVILFAIGPAVFFTVLIVDVLAIYGLFRPLAHFFEAERGGDQNPRLARAAYLRTLNFPLLTLLRIMLLHGPTGLVAATLYISMLNRSLALGLESWQIAATWANLFTVVAAHAVLEAFAVALAMRPLIPHLARIGGPLPAVYRRRVVRLGLRQRQLTLSLFLTFVPLILLAVTLLFKVNRLLFDLDPVNRALLLAPMVRWAAILIASTMGVALIISLLMARELGGLVSGLADAMRRVGQGEIDTQLAVLSTDEFADLYDGFNGMAAGLAERERLRDAFGRYVAPEVVQEVTRHGVSLGGSRVTGSVLFADIRGFTSLSERLEPEMVVTLLNSYFAAVEPAIRAEGGWINKFGGDSLLAVFGAPVPQPDHAARAVRAALGILRALATLNATRRALGDSPLRIGVGLHCGEMVAGSVGSPERLEYTVIGDVVNVAARIEAQTKEWGVALLMSDEISRASGITLPLRPMPPAHLRGKAEPLTLFALDG